MRRGLMAVACLLALCGAAAADDGLTPKSSKLPNPADVGIDQRLGQQVNLDLVFRDEIGQERTLRQCVDGKPTILVLAYFRCPQLCTQVLNGLLDAMRVLPFNVGEQFNVITVSFDPRERPPLAAAKSSAYLQEYGRPGAEKGWRFLTGDQPQIAELARDVGFRYRWDEEHQQYDHAAGIMILTPDGRVSRYFYGIEYGKWDDTKQQFGARDLRLGLVEASGGKIGSPVDQLLLFCMHYDPKTGKYTAAVMVLMRTAGVLTMLAIGVPVGLMWWRERRKRKSEVQGATCEVQGFSPSPLAGEGEKPTRRGRLAPYPVPRTSYL